MSIKDLIIGDRIRIQEFNSVEITVQIKNVYRLVQSSLDIDKWVADVEAIDERTWTIDDCYDFYSLPNGNEETKKTLDDKVNHPSHYNSEKGIDLIEFCRQQFTEEEFRGAMKFTQMRYSLRTGRKENDIQDQKKLEEYAKRFVGALENGR